MKYYAKIKDGKVEEVLRTDNPTEEMVECNKPIYVYGKRYIGNLPKKGYKYVDNKFIKE